MLIKTSELSGAALDWAVAMAEGWEADRPCDGQIKSEYRHLLVGKCPVWGNPHNYYSPSTEWAHGGPLLDKFHVSIDWNTCNDDDPDYDREPWMDTCGQRLTSYGPTARIALCRAIVAAKLGDEVEVPDELLSAPL